jgi:hypothetical protein
MKPVARGEPSLQSVGNPLSNPWGTLSPIRGEPSLQSVGNPLSNPWGTLSPIRGDAVSGPQQNQFVPIHLAGLIRA